MFFADDIYCPCDIFMAGPNDLGVFSNVNDSMIFK